MNGGTGFDTLDFSNAGAALTVDLSKHTISGAATGNDLVYNFETLIASGFADSIKGSKYAETIIGGGDSVKAINKAGMGDKVTFMSTGGGAMLEYLHMEKGDPPKTKDIFEGIDMTWGRVTGGQSIGDLIDHIQAGFDPQQPEKSVAENLKLAELQRIPGVGFAFEPVKDGRAEHRILRRCAKHAEQPVCPAWFALWVIALRV